MLQLIKRNKLFFIPYLIFLLVGAFFLLYYSKQESFLLINQHHYLFFDFFFKYFTFLGDGRFVILVIIILLFINYSQAIILAVSYLFSGAITQLLKKVFFYNNDRPISILKKELIHLVDGVDLHSMHSFPSGHSTSAFCLCAILAFIAPKSKGLLYFTLAFLAAYSRIYLAQHFLEDIYVGSLVGVVVSIFVFYFLTKKFQSINKNWPDLSLLKSYNQNK